MAPGGFPPPCWRAQFVPVGAAERTGVAALRRPLREGPVTETQVPAGPHLHCYFCTWRFPGRTSKLPASGPHSDVLGAGRSARYIEFSGLGRKDSSTPYPCGPVHIFIPPIHPYQIGTHATFGR